MFQVKNLNSQHPIYITLYSTTLRQGGVDVSRGIPWISINVVKNFVCGYNMNHVTWTKTSTAKSFSPWHQKSSSVPKNWRFWGLWIKVYVDSYGTYFHSLKSLKSWKVNQTIFWLLPILTWYYFIFISTWYLRIDKYKVQKQKYFSILRRTKKIKKKTEKKIKNDIFYESTKWKK